MPVHLRVIGTGVKFSGPQLVSNKKNVPNWIERINFGSRIINLEWQGGDGVKVGRNVSDSKTEPGRSFDLESFSKTVTVENQSPKTVTLQWRTYTHCKTDDAQLGAADVFAASDILNDDYLLQPDDSGIIEVIPKSMTIPAFKSVPLRVLFRSAVRGSYDALVMAEVGYSEPDGSLRFAPVLPTSKRYFKSLARLHVQAKVIEPHLSLDDGLKSIRIKKKLTAASQDGKSMGKVAGSRTVNVFLKNNSDAICLFYLEISPSDQFSIKTSRAKVVDTSEVNMSRARSSRGAGGGIHPEVERTFTGQPLYELKPTEQMLIAVTYQEKPGTPSETLRSDNPLIVGATEKGTSSSFVFDDSSTTATPPSTSSSNTRPTAQTSTMNPTEIEKQLKVTFTNGMVQSFPIIVETSYKVSPSQT